MAGTETRIGKILKDVECHAKGLKLYPVDWSLQAGGRELTEKKKKKILGTCLVLLLCSFKSQLLSSISWKNKKNLTY